jgi:hypothetical protein
MRKGLNVINLPEGTVAQLYNTRIYDGRDGKIILNSGGWRTRHTKNCINDLLPKDYYLYQEAFTWYVKTPKGLLVFKDGMEI